MLLNRFMVEPSFGFWVLAKTFIPNQGSTFQKLIWTGVRLDNKKTEFANNNFNISGNIS